MPIEIDGKSLTCANCAWYEHLASACRASLPGALSMMPVPGEDGRPVIATGWFQVKSHAWCRYHSKVPGGPGELKVETGGGPEARDGPKVVRFEPPRIG